MKKGLKEHSTQIYISLFVGALGIPVATLLPQATTKSEEIVAAFVSFILLFLLALIASELVVIVSQREIIAEIEKSLELLMNQNSFLAGASKSVHYVLVRYSRRYWRRISNKDQKILIGDYLILLEESLNVASKRIFATSLIKPSAWLDDTLYKRYLDKQINRKNEVEEIDIRRIFLLTPGEFFNDGKCNELINKHIDAGLGIGFCDVNKIDRDHVLDLVIFEEKGDKWVVEGGNIPKNLSSSDTKTPLDMHFHYSDDSLDPIDHWEKDIKNYITFFKCEEDFTNEKQNRGF